MNNINNIIIRRNYLLYTLENYYKFDIGEPETIITEGVFGSAIDTIKKIFQAIIDWIKKVIESIKNLFKGRKKEQEKIIEVNTSDTIKKINKNLTRYQDEVQNQIKECDTFISDLNKSLEELKNRDSDSNENNLDEKIKNTKELNKLFLKLKESQEEFENFKKELDSKSKNNTKDLVMQQLTPPNRVVESITKEIMRMVNNNDITDISIDEDFFVFEYDDPKKFTVEEFKTNFKYYITVMNKQDPCAESLNLFKKNMDIVANCIIDGAERTEDETEKHRLLKKSENIKKVTVDSVTKIAEKYKYWNQHCDKLYSTYIANNDIDKLNEKIENKKKEIDKIISEIKKISNKITIK